MDARLYYREGTVAGSSPVALVARLYEQIVDDLRQAIQALDRGDIELRTGKINHALLVIGHLESQLNFAKGGQVAQHLKDFYDSVRANLLQAQMRQSKPLLAQQITDLLTVREAWVAVGAAVDAAVHVAVDQEQKSATPAATNPLPAASPVSAAQAPRLDWKG
jgi:flagellar secretion chaperone FliS